MIVGRAVKCCSKLDAGREEVVGRKWWGGGREEEVVGRRWPL